MTRSELLTLTDTPETKFNNLVRDRVLPFQPSRSGPRKHAEYSARDALALDLANCFVLAGSPWQSAALSVRTSMDDLATEMRTRSGGPDVYLVQLGRISVDPDGIEPTTTGVFEVVCSLGELAGALERQTEHLAREGDRRPNPPSWIVQVNASERLRMILSRVDVHPAKDRLQAAFDALWDEEREPAPDAA